MQRAFFQLVLVLVLVLEGYCQTAAFKRTGTNLPFVVTVASNHVVMVERGGGLAPANVSFENLRKSVLTFDRTNYLLRLGSNPETPGYSSNSITFSNGVMRFDTSYALERGIHWGGYTVNGYYPGYIQFGNQSSGGSFLLRAGDIGIESPKDFSSIRMTDDHRLDGLMKISAQSIGGLVFPSNNFSGMFALQVPVTNGAGTYIPGYPGFRGKNATGVAVFTVDGESWSQSEIWGYTLIPPPNSQANGGYRSVGDTNWFMIGTTNSLVVKGLTVSGNSLSQWPTNARSAGDSMIVNSNGTLLVLISGATTAWTRTNVLSAPPAAVDQDAEKFFTASEISDTTIKNAVTTLAIRVKAAGLWEKVQVLYPLVGGTSNTHSWNLKDTNTFRIGWSGGVTHNFSGITGDGTTGYGNTFYNPSTNGSLNSQHIAVYCKTQTPNDGGNYISVATGEAGDKLALFRNGVNSGSIVNAAAYNDIAASSDQRGFFSASRIAAIGTNAMNNNLRGVVQQYTSASVALPNANVFLLARNWPDYGTDAYTTANLGLASIGSGLTAAESDQLRSAVELFQSELGR